MANRLDYYFRQRVTEAELDLGFSELEEADHAIATDFGFVGVLVGALVVQHGPVPDLTVDVSGPASILDQEGRRIFFATLQNVNVGQDENAVSTAVSAGGQEKIVSVFVKFDRALSDARVDGNSLTVFFLRDESFKFIVVQGAEAPVGTAIPPALRSDAILLADVTRTFGQTQVLAAAISIARRQDALVLAGSPRSIRRGRTSEALADLLSYFNTHVAGAADRHPASSIDYGGGGAWADSTTNPATTIELQVDKIVSDLAAATGAPKIGAAATAGSPNALVPGGVKSQVDALLGFLNTHINQASGAHAASAISYAGGPAWADASTNPATNAEAQLDKIVTDLAAGPGAARIGADAAAGTPHSLASGSVRSQLNSLLGSINSHITQATGAHAADTISYAGGGNWSDGVTNPPTSVEAQLDKIITDLSQSGGGTKIGASAAAGSPELLAGGSVKSQINALLGFVNARGRLAAVNTWTANQTFDADILPGATGRDLGSGTARWDAFLRDVSATASATTIPALRATAFDATTAAIQGGGTGVSPTEGIWASHPDGPGIVWDRVRGWAFFPEHTGEVPTATELLSVTQMNIVKAWGHVASAGTLSSPTGTSTRSASRQRDAIRSPSTSRPGR